jgi:hypothetical protein
MTYKAAIWRLLVFLPALSALPATRNSEVNENAKVQSRNHG